MDIFIYCSYFHTIWDLYCRSENLYTYTFLRYLCGVSMNHSCSTSWMDTLDVIEKGNPRHCLKKHRSIHSTAHCAASHTLGFMIIHAAVHGHIQEYQFLTVHIISQPPLFTWVAAPWCFATASMKLSSFNLHPTCTSYMSLISKAVVLPGGMFLLHMWGVYLEQW